jgi:hypothetical protein
MKINPLYDKYFMAFIYFIWGVMYNSNIIVKQIPEFIHLKVLDIIDGISLSRDIIQRIYEGKPTPR